MNPNLLSVAIAEAPAIIGFLRVAFAKHHPDDPVPTDAEVMAAYEAAFTASIAKDDRWLATHPDPPIGPV